MGSWCTFCIVTLFFFTWYIVHIFWFHYLFICIFYFFMYVGQLFRQVVPHLYDPYDCTRVASSVLKGWCLWGLSFSFHHHCRLPGSGSHWPSLGPLKQPSNWCSVSIVHSSEQTLYCWWWHFSASKLSLAPFVYTIKPKHHNFIALGLCTNKTGWLEHMKRCMCTTFLGIREMQTKPQWGTTSQLTRINIYTYFNIWGDVLKRNKYW